MTAFESLARPLLFGHLAAAVCLAGSAVHLAVHVCRHWMGHSPSRRQVKLHTWIVAVSYAACFALGAIVYPTFRVRVRHEVFDKAMRWATGLFEAKEHLATIGLIAALALLALSRVLSGWFAGTLTIAALGSLLALAAEIISHEFSKWGTWGTWQ